MSQSKAKATNIVSVNNPDQMQSHIKNIMVCSENKCVIVFNFAHWCGACQMFMPEWLKFEALHNKSVDHIFKIESSSYQHLPYSNVGAYKHLTANGELYFPMIILYINGKKYMYEGSRTAADLKSFIQAKKQAAKPQKNVKEQPKSKTVVVAKPVVKKVQEKASSTKKPAPKKTGTK